MAAAALCWALGMFAGDAGADDPFLWLEEVEGSTALDWVRARNQESLTRLEADPRFEVFQSQILAILEDQDRIPAGQVAGPWIDNFWQDPEHVRGIWRRTTRAGYRSATTEWETILDIDALAAADKENWVYHGHVEDGPGDFRRAMVSLSRGGSDASVWREFDVAKRAFVDGGFDLPEAKTRLAWLNSDELLVGTDFGPGSLTTSGYPRVIKRWKRGTPLESATVLFEGEPTDVSVSAQSAERADRNVHIITRAMTFFTAEHFLLDAQGKLHPIPAPKSAELSEVFNGWILFVLREPWESPDGSVIPAGSLVRLAIDRLDQGPAVLESVWQPTDRQSIQQVVAGRNWLNLSILDNVAGSILRLREGEDGFETVRVDLPENGTVGIMTASPLDDDLYVTYTGFLDPPSLYEVHETPPTHAERIKQLEAKFDTAGLVVERHDAPSADGTKVPYFVVRPEKTPMNGSTPTLLYGYGGFEIPMLPSYSAGIGKLWLTKGNAYVLACIRGGGEFGPKWHQAALKTDRQRGFDDFIAVAEDLIRTGLTSPPHLGIMGASNGGLLVGTVFTQRPDLFGAVVCGVPLLDMLRFSQLLAGASWMAEYGNPEIAEEREALLRYSPYHNVRKETRYPEPFFVTSTKDDRVHPGHARKMVARMIEQGHPVMYFENIEGGHGAAANLKQRARRTALEFVYLSQKLAPASKP